MARSGSIPAASTNQVGCAELIGATAELPALPEAKPGNLFQSDPKLEPRLGKAHAEPGMEAPREGMSRKPSAYESKS
jgi:hypothetical protein